jgi:hypothetical protein
MVPARFLARVARAYSPTPAPRIPNSAASVAGHEFLEIELLNQRITYRHRVFNSSSAIVLPSHGLHVTRLLVARSDRQRSARAYAPSQGLGRR